MEEDEVHRRIVDIFTRKYKDSTDPKDFVENFDQFIDDAEFVLAHGDQAQKNVFRRLLNALFDQAKDDMDNLCEKMHMTPQEVAQVLVDPEFKGSQEYEELKNKADLFFHNERLMARQEQKAARSKGKPKKGHQRKRRIDAQFRVKDY
ncbi:MAG: hypothetical protein S4CHLAM102_04770 [Chlamydiia bacterium]|nr:hypothetical protein [Chlamydiia bacterium]